MLALMSAGAAVAGVTAMAMSTSSFVEASEAVRRGARNVKL